jgi:hypothetical protein
MGGGESEDVWHHHLSCIGVAQNHEGARSIGWMKKYLEHIALSNIYQLLDARSILVVFNGPIYTDVSG